jgi:hypothetical protein
MKQASTKLFLARQQEGAFSSAEVAALIRRNGSTD